MSNSAHAFTIGSTGPKGADGSPPHDTADTAPYESGAATGPTGPIGATGPSGPTGAAGPGYDITGITYSSTGPNAFRFIVEYEDGKTTDGGYFRGPTGETIYNLYGVNMGYATGGAFYHDNVDNTLYLKSITGGAGLAVETVDVDGKKKLRIRYRTFDAAPARGTTGQLALHTQGQGGETGLSGATLTHFYPGITQALRLTNYNYSEVSGRVRPTLPLDIVNNVYEYEINLTELLSIRAAKTGSSIGNTFIFDPTEDYREEFDMPLRQGDSVPQIKIKDVSLPFAEEASSFNQYYQDFGNFAGVGFTVIIKNSEMIDYPYENPFPPNWKFPYSLSPTISGGIDIIQFISLGYRDYDESTEVGTKKTEWYGMYVRSNSNPFFG